MVEAARQVCRQVAFEHVFYESHCLLLCHMLLTAVRRVKDDPEALRPLTKLTKN